MQLNQVHAVDTQPLQGGVKLLKRLLGGSLVRLGGQEKLLAMPTHPGSDTLFSFTLPIAGCRVQMIDAVLEKNGQRRVRFPCLTEPSAAPPKIVRVLECRVLPNSFFSITLALPLRVCCTSLMPLTPPASVQY